MFATRAAFWRQLVVAGLLSAATIGVGFGIGRAHAETMRASFYDHGTITASGAPFDWRASTVASRTLAFGTRVLACLDACGIATVTDRGPFVAGRDMDFSRGFARLIGLERRGVALVRVSIIGGRFAPHRRGHHIGQRRRF